MAQMTDTDKARFSKKIVRVDRSPMNPKVWCHQLECGHEVWQTGKSRKKYLVCPQCKS